MRAVISNINSALRSNLRDVLWSDIDRLNSAIVHLTIGQNARRTRASKHARTHTHTHARSQARTHVHTHTRTHTHAHTHAHTHTHTHTHPYTHTRTRTRTPVHAHAEVMICIRCVNTYACVRNMTHTESNNRGTKTGCNRISDTAELVPPDFVRITIRRHSTNVRRFSVVVADLSIDATQVWIIY